MKKIVLMGIVLVAAAMCGGCSSMDPGGSEQAGNGGALGVAQKYGLVSDSNAQKAKKAAEFFFGKVPPSPVQGWNYDSGIRYVGEQPLAKNGEARPQDFEAWAQYSRTWRPFDAILTAPAGVSTPAPGSAVTGTNSAPWKNTGELATAFEAMFDAVDKEGAK